MLTENKLFTAKEKHFQLPEINPSRISKKLNKLLIASLLCREIKSKE